jgi:N-methylhydantoinase A/acetophenone carboxylase
MYTISVDIGGTFTDGLFTCGEETRQAKVFTTPHDYTECFLECLKGGADLFGIGLESMLLDTVAIKLSSTIGTNMLVQQKGSRLGLIVTRGYEDTLYASDPEASESVKSKLIANEMIFGINADGIEHKQMSPEDASELLEAVRTMIEKRVTMIAVSLKGADLDSGVEEEVRSRIHEFYPEHYLRYIPIQVSTDVSDMPGDIERTSNVCFNAYLHKELGSSLYRIEDKLRNQGYRNPLLVVNTYAGTTRIAKTRAIDTYGSGPVSGLIGAAKWQKIYDIPNVVAVDLGGTSLDVGIVIRGEVPYNLNPVVDGIPLQIPMVDVRSLGAGGGSICWMEETGELHLGPESAGAIPGPACYGRGGEKPTTTDADVILGYIDPDYFLGGSFKLDKDAAAKAFGIISERLGVKVEEAALRAVQELHVSNTERIKSFMEHKGHHPDEFVMMSYGGAGGVHCCGLGKTLGISKIMVFPTSSVFGAYGASVLDVSHIIQRNLSALLYEESSTSYLSDVSLIKDAVNALVQQGRREMKSEGFEGEDIGFEGSFVLGDVEGKNKIRVAYPKLAPDDESDVKSLCDTFRAEVSGLQEVNLTGDIQLFSCMLMATCRLPRGAIEQQQSFVGEDSSAALKGSRLVYWEGKGFETTSVYDWNSLKSGNVLVGPSLVEATDTTYVIYPGVLLRIDNNGNGVMELDSLKAT